jgi:hypothetical protein
MVLIISSHEDFISGYEPEMKSFLGRRYYMVENPKWVLTSTTRESTVRPPLLNMYLTPIQVYWRCLIDNKNNKRKESIQHITMGIKLNLKPRIGYYIKNVHLHRVQESKRLKKRALVNNLIFHIRLLFWIQV